MRVALAIVLVTLAACAGILGLRKPVAPAFPHRAHVVAGVACVTCHAGVERAGDTGPLHLPGDDGCTSCHQPHTEGTCLGCHGDAFTVAAVADARTHLRFAHADHASAAKGQCVTCHRGVAEGDGPLRPVMATCYRCHQDEQTLRTCETCHVDLAWEGTLPASHLVHEGDWIRDHGARAAASGDVCASCHTERSCAACHGAEVAALPARRFFDDPSTASVHRAGFVARHGIEARLDPGACSTCHTPSTCTTCHLASGVGDDRALRDRSPHPAGWVAIAGDNEHGRAARRDPAACAACHGGAGEALCVDCHRVGAVGGNPHPPGWSSRQSLGDAPCRLCHPGLR